MAYLVGSLIGASIAAFVVTRVFLWAFTKIGDNQRRIFFAYAVAFPGMVWLAGMGFADGGPPRFGYAALTYGLPTAFWLAVDLLGLKGRSTKRSQIAS